MESLSRRSSVSSNRGVALVMTLIILVVMTLSSLAMIAGMRAGSATSGNIAFRQAASRVADIGVRVAYDRVQTMLQGDRTILNANSVADGYFAQQDFVAAGCAAAGITVFSPLTYDFTNTTDCAVQVAGTGADNLVAGYRVYYVIHRMSEGAGACSDAAGPVSTVNCSLTPLERVLLKDFNDGTIKTDFSTTRNFVYYRITVKVVGPRNNNRYVQAFVF